MGQCPVPFANTSLWSCGGLFFSSFFKRDQYMTALTQLVFNQDTQTCIVPCFVTDPVLSHLFWVL